MFLLNNIQSVIDFSHNHAAKENMYKMFDFFSLNSSEEEKIN